MNKLTVFPKDIAGYCHVGLIPSNAMLNECRLTFTVATGFHEKSSQNASGITFDLA